MGLTKALNKKFIIAIIEWDGERVKSLHEAKQRGKQMPMKVRAVVMLKHKQRDGLIYTIIQARSYLNQAIRDSMRYGMLSQLHLPEYKDIKEIYSYDEWIEKYPIKSDK